MVRFSRAKREIDYCTETLKPLLDAMGSELLNVRYRHGNLEFGKDFTFSYINPLNQRVNAWIQVKFGDIKGTSTEIINKIINQCKVAFKVPYKNKPDGQELFINELYLLCSGEFKANAIEIIERTLEKEFNVFFWMVLI